MDKPIISNAPGTELFVMGDKVWALRTQMYRILGAVELTPKERDELKEYVNGLLELRTRLKDE